MNYLLRGTRGRQVSRQQLTTKSIGEKFEKKNFLQPSFDRNQKKKINLRPRTNLALKVRNKDIYS